MNNKIVVITGATSMIGTAIIRAYLHNDVETIYAVVRPNSPNLQRLPNDHRIKVIECTANEYANLTSIIREKCDTFFHVAWDGTGATRSKSIYGQAQNILFTLTALKVAKDLGCEKFIGAGSQAEYGRLDLPQIDEDSPANPVIPYGIAKYAAGKLTLVEAEKLDIECFWVRIFSVYGLFDKPTTMISNAIPKMKAGERMAFTPAIQRWDYLNADDAGRAFYLIGEKSHGRKVYCLGSGEAKELKEFIYILRDIVNPDVEVGIGDIPYKGTEIMNLCANISRIQNDTGWRPKISFEEGIRKII